jgi:putative inorganic carbon (hco3(-)) transporter
VQRALLILLFAASYLLFAGVTPWALGALLIIAALAALSSPATTFRFPKKTRPIDVALLALVVGIGLQMVPMPANIIAALSPNAAGIREAVRFAPLGTPPPAYTTLSINPGATLFSFGTVVLGVLSFWTARTVFNAGGGTRLFCKVLAFLGALAAAMAVIQKAVAPRAALFVLAADSPTATPFGAFINRNHFAAWMLMVATPVAGYCIARMRIHPTRRGRWRESIGQILSSGAIFTTVAAVMMILVLLVTLSRSALAGLAAAALTGWVLGKPRLQIERTNVPGLLGFIGTVLLLVVTFVDVDSWASRLEQSFSSSSEFDRLTIWRESWPIAEDFWLTGTGAGTYSNAMTVYQQTRVWVGAMQNWAHFNNAHSHYVQVAAEGGLLLGLPSLGAIWAVVVLGWRAVRADKGEMFWVRIGAAAGLAGLAVQSIWEVSLIMPANAVLAGMLAGLLLYQRDAAPRQDSMSPTNASLTPPPPARLRMAR